MKHIIIFSFIFFTSFHFQEKKVFVCGATGAKKYHYNENCRGLKGCSHEIVKMSVSKAQNYGLTLCGWED